MFSPYYARARRRGLAEATDFCALNVALYGRGPRRWAMTERGTARISVARHEFAIGPSALRWTGDAIEINIDERAAPLPLPVRGRVRLIPGAITRETFVLNPAGRHLWWPIAPIARIEVMLDRPDVAWHGNGYFDHNRGDEPIARGFRDWTWSRAMVGADAVIHYDGVRRDGAPFGLGLRFSPDGRGEPVPLPPSAALPRTFWRLERRVRSEPGPAARVIETLEDTPFYARSLVATRVGGVGVTAMHESLSLDRLETAIVQRMLPFRMPRRA